MRIISKQQSGHIINTVWLQNKSVNQRLREVISAKDIYATKKSHAFQPLVGRIFRRYLRDSPQILPHGMSEI